MTTSATVAPIGGLTLVIEASSAAGSVALLRGSKVLRQRAVAMGVSREDALFPSLQAMLGEEGVVPSELTAIVCGSGPGSFTSLRIAAAIAKGFAHAASVPLYAVPSLLLAAAAHDTPGRYLVHSDALRGERYAMPVTIDSALAVHADDDVVRVSNDAIAALAGERRQLIVAGGASVANALSSVPESSMLVMPNAARLPRIDAWQQHGAVSLDAWEPAYGRLAEAQVKWEAAHQRPLPTG